MRRNRSTSIAERDSPLRGGNVAAVALFSILLVAALVTRTPLKRWFEARQEAPSQSAAAAPLPPATPPATPPAERQLPPEPQSPPASASPSSTAGQVASAAPQVVERVPVLMPVAPPAPPPDPQVVLVEALRTGQLRIGNQNDLSAWTTRWGVVNHRNLPQRFGEHMRYQTVYVVQKDFAIPDGLNGANAVVFLVEPYKPFPRGKPGHSVILDVSSGACVGVVCGMMLSDD